MWFLIFWAFIAYIVHFYWEEYLNKNRGLPGPIPFPILGNLVQVALASKPGERPSQALSNLSRKYGEIYQLQMGTKTMVVMSSIETINSVYSRPEASGRDQTGSLSDRMLNKNLGIIMSEGPYWDKTRNWTIKNLRDYGFGKSSTMESNILEEIQLLFKKIDEYREKDDDLVPVHGLYILYVFKLMWKMIAGQLSEEDLPVIANLLVKSEQALAAGVFGPGIIIAYPFVRHIAPEITGHTAQMDFYRNAHLAAKNLLHKSQAVMSQKEADRGKVEPENLVESFICKMKEEEGKEDSIFTVENWKMIYMDLMQAGADTNSAFLEGFTLLMTKYPDVQERIYHEIKQNIPIGHEITMNDRKNMIYTQAALLEVHRHQKVIQNLVPRRVMDDFYYKDQLIKKGSILVPDLQSAYMSKTIWDDPEEFRPERFIGANGDIINQNCIMPFGAGKRLCPGESLSAITSFLYVTSILRRYKIHSIPGNAAQKETWIEGMTTVPVPFKTVFSKRN